MGYLRYYRRTKIMPGVSLNMSRSGPSLTFGARGAHMTVSRRAITRTVGIPGTGVFYTSRSGHHTGVHSGHRQVARAAAGAGAGGCLLTLINAALAALYPR